MITRQKKVRDAYKAYKRSKLYSLEDCYERYSRNKDYEMQRIWNKFIKENGCSLKIISYNCHFFTVGYKVYKDGNWWFKWITPYNVYVMPLIEND